jgi:ABC-2 type transport system permease protein
LNIKKQNIITRAADYLTGSAFVRGAAKHIKICLCYFRLNLSSALEYRASFFIQSLGMAINNGTFLFFWWILFEQIGGSIADYSFRDIVFIWAVCSSAFGLSYVLFANASNLTRLIVTGELDTFLVQPCNTLLSVLCSRTSLSSYGDFIYGFIIIAVFYGAAPAAWLWFGYGVLVGLFIFTAIILTAHSLSFFWGDASAVGQMATEFSLTFSLYPDKIYAPLIRGLMYSLIPAGLAVHVPLRLLRDFSLLTALVSLAGAAVYCVGAACVFYIGLRRYESGNVIVTRM